MKIQVTQYDIDHGYPMDCYNCPIALAIMREIPHWVTVRVGWVDIGLYAFDNFPSDHPNKVIKLPENASEWIKKFDHGVKVEPFEFELEEE